MKSLHVVCAVLVNAEGEVLLCKRPVSKHQAGLWEFPGGKVDGEESEAEALRREISEELDCAIVVGESLTPVEHAYADFSVCLVPFLCTLGEGVPRAIEHDEICWVPVGALADFKLSPADVPIMNELGVRVSIL